MALYHVDMHCFAKGKWSGAAFARYLCREEVQPGMRAHAYHVNEHPGRSDLTACGYGGLPNWAHDGVHFFQMADRFERANANIARGVQISLPQELSPQARLELSQDLVATFYAHYPHVFAVHTPSTRDGREQPHLHVLISERQCPDTYELSPQAYFARAANLGRDEREGGARKDPSWQGVARLREFRHEVALVINAALERENTGVAISSLSLKDRDHDRRSTHLTIERAQAAGLADETSLKSWQATLDDRNLQQREDYPWETAMNLLAWEKQKREEHIRSLDRQAIIDRVRDHFFREDARPAREQERLESIARAIVRERELTGRFFPQPVPEPQRQRTLGWGRLSGHLDDTPQGGVHVQLEERERERSR